MKNATSATLFLPAAGFRNDTDLDDTGSYGLCWSSSLYTDYPNYAWYLYFYSGDADTYYGNRYYGFSVRPVSE